MRMIFAKMILAMAIVAGSTNMVGCGGPLPMCPDGKTCDVDGNVIAPDGGTPVTDGGTTPSTDGGTGGTTARPNAIVSVSVTNQTNVGITAHVWDGAHGSLTDGLGQPVGLTGGATNSLQTVSLCSWRPPVDVGHLGTNPGPGIMISVNSGGNNWWGCNDFSHSATELQVTILGHTVRGVLYDDPTACGGNHNLTNIFVSAASVGISCT